MLKRYIAVFFSVLIMLPVISANAATLTLSARIIAGSCTVNPVLAAGQQQSLGSLLKSGLTESGDADPVWHNFSLELTGCPPTTTSSTVKFTGTPDSNDGTLFANTAPAGSAAQNVAVEMSKQSNNSDILSNGSTMTVKVETTNGTASFPLAARMKTPTGNVGQGDVAAIVQVEFTYQ